MLELILLICLAFISLSLLCPTQVLKVSIQFHCLLPLLPPWRPHKASLKQKTTKQQLLLLLFSQTIQNKKESKLCTNYFPFSVGHENYLQLNLVVNPASWLDAKRLFKQLLNYKVNLLETDAGI